MKKIGKIAPMRSFGINLSLILAWILTLMPVVGFGQVTLNQDQTTGLVLSNTTVMIPKGSDLSTVTGIPVMKMIEVPTVKDYRPGLITFDLNRTTAIIVFFPGKENNFFSQKLNTVISARPLNAEDVRRIRHMYPRKLCGYKYGNDLRQMLESQKYFLATSVIDQY